MSFSIKSNVENLKDVYILINYFSVINCVEIFDVIESVISKQYHGQKQG